LLVPLKCMMDFGGALPDKEEPAKDQDQIATREFLA
jgi:hypothetical protein